VGDTAPHGLSSTRHATYSRCRAETGDPPALGGLPALLHRADLNIGRYVTGQAFTA